MKNKSRKFLGQTDRRSLLKQLAVGGVTLGVGGLNFVPRAYGQAAPNRFLQIVLNGGWDGVLSTDPASPNMAHPATIYNKSQSGAYQPEYYTPAGGNPIVDPATQVAGKSNLWLGEGLKGSAAAFGTIPTAFVNGMFMEVTAHELAMAYMLTGRLSLSRSREYPSFVALMADATGGFPAHVVLGNSVPLGDTKNTNPPLQSINASLFNYMLAGPRMRPVDETDPFVLTDNSIGAADNLIATMNNGFQAKLGNKAKDGFTPWVSAETGINDFYAKRFDQTLTLEDTVANNNIVTRYNVAADDSAEARLATAFLALENNLSPFITVNFGEFDTHTGHLGSHVPAMQQVSMLLNTLIADLLAVDDPTDGTKKLVETTTVLVTSEFNRTPLFNGNSGTDHWQTSNAILLGNGVQDNTVIGATDANANALGWDGSSAVAMAADNSNAILPDHLAATILRRLGFNSAADTVSGVTLNGLFT